jgi:CBS domain-containing protein
MGPSAQQQETLMNIGSICKREVVTVREFDELSAAARLMREKHVGYLVVVNSNSANGRLIPAGVLTDRDIVVSVLAQDANPGALRVGDIMTRGPLVVGESASIASALKEMRRVGVRRVPVVGRIGELVGVLSLDDILDSLAGELLDVAGSVRNEQLIEGSLSRRHRDLSRDAQLTVARRAIGADRVLHRVGAVPGRRQR